MFKVSDIIQPLYQEASQQLATLLVGDVGLFWAMDMALCDIYSFEGTLWGFMNKTQEIEFVDGDGATKTFTLDYPIVRVNGVFNLDTTDVDPIQVKAVASPYHVASTGDTHGKYPIHFNPLEKTITLTKEAGMTQAVSYFGWYEKPTSRDSIIPVPDAFKAAFRDLSLHYLLGPQGQYGEQKSGDLHARGMDKLRQLSKSGLGQISDVTFTKIN